MLNNSDFQNDKKKMEQACLSVIEGLGIYELRALSRVFGDNSPTTLKRDEHIKSIMSKLLSGEEPRPLPVRQGRPYKELSSLKGILQELSNITGKNYCINNDKALNVPHIQKNIIFRQVENDIIAQQLFPIKAKGILCTTASGDLFFYNQYNFKRVLVSKEHSQNLAPYDFVEGTAVLMNNNNEYITKSIDKINFENIATYNSNSDEYKKCNPYQTISFEGKNFVLGNRYRMNMNKFVDNKQEISSLVCELKKNQVSTLAIIPNVPEEDVLDIQSIGFDNHILFKYNEKTSDTVYNTLLIVNDFIKRQQEIGKNLAIFVQDPVTLFNMLDYCVKTQKIYMGHTEETAEMFKELGSLACAGENNKSTTIFFTFDNVDLYDALYVSLVYKVYKSLDI